MDSMRLDPTHASAVATGLFVGIVLPECLLTALDHFVIGGTLNEALASGRPGTALLTITIGAWVAGGLLAGLVATLMSGSRTTGVVAGSLMMLPALVLAMFAVPGETLASAWTISPLVGAAAGARLADRLSSDPG